MKYIVLGIIVLIAVVAWWLHRRDAILSTRDSATTGLSTRHEEPPRDRGVGGSGSFSGGGNT